MVNTRHGGLCENLGGFETDLRAPRSTINTRPHQPFSSFPFFCLPPHAHTKPPDTHAHTHPPHTHAPTIPPAPSYTPPAATLIRSTPSPPSSPSHPSPLRTPASRPLPRPRPPSRRTRPTTNISSASPLTAQHTTAASFMTGVAPTTKQPPPRAMHPAPPPPPPANNTLLHGAVEKQRRAGKYTHPFGGMRQFAEDRAARSGWDHDCLAIDNLESRRIARSNLADRISDMYKEEFVRVNKAQGKGRPKANNISAAKKTVRMIAERILLSLEARATQNLFKQVMENRRQSEKELTKLRHIHNCGRENPKLSYDEIRSIARARLGTAGDASPANSPDIPAGTPESPDFESEEANVEIEMMKQAIVEMRAEEVSKGFKPKLLNSRWVERMTHACKRLVHESYSSQFVPRTKVYGCKHFTRKNRVLMVCCGTFPVCRMCHIQDLNRIHDVRIEPVKTMLCMMCGEVQPKTQKCRKCDVCFGSYYCDVCGITDDTPGYDLRHCNKCNVCMPGLTFHCDKCKSCVPATPDHDAVCHGAGGANPENQPPPQPVTVNNVPTPGEAMDQSITHLAANVEARENQLFTGL